MRIKVRQHVQRAERMLCQTGHNFGVGQHPLQFITHGLRGNPMVLFGRQRVSQGVRGRVVENERVQHDVGVDDQAQTPFRRWRYVPDDSPPFLRAEPLTMSKRNIRHSMGPFHIGTRRDSLRRILLGNFRSGVSTQAVQSG